MATSIKRITEYLTAFDINFELHSADKENPYSFDGESYILIEPVKNTHQSTSISLIEQGRGIHFETIFSSDYVKYVGLDYGKENTTNILRFMLEQNSECHLGYWSLLTSHPYIAYRQSLRIEDADLTAKQILSMIRTICSSETQEKFRAMRLLINPEDSFQTSNEIIALRKHLHRINQKLTTLEMEEDLKGYG